MPGRWNFFNPSMDKIARALGAKVCKWPFFEFFSVITWDILKIPKTAYSVANFLPKIYIKHFSRVIGEENRAKKRYFKKGKNGPFSGPYAQYMGPPGRKRPVFVRFGPKRICGAIFSQIGVGLPTALHPFLVQTLLRRSWQWSRSHQKIEINQVILIF